jgi:hypothetical protein
MATCVLRTFDARGDILNAKAELAHAVAAVLHGAVSGDDAVEFPRRDGIDGCGPWPPAHYFWTKSCPWHARHRLRSSGVSCRV